MWASWLLRAEQRTDGGMLPGLLRVLLECLLQRMHRQTLCGGGRNRTAASDAQHLASIHGCPPAMTLPAGS